MTPTPTSTISVLQVLMSALRIAGITLRPGRIPSTDQATEALAVLNSMIGSWNCGRLNIYTVGIQAFTLTPGQKTFTIGPGGQFDTARPQEITAANIIVNTTSPVTRVPVEIINDQEWSEINVQDIPNGIPSKLYNDGAYPLSTLYLWTQAFTTYQLELYTWSAVPTFATIADAVVLPPGYQLAIEYNLAILLAQHYPLESKMLPTVYQWAREALAAIQHLNAPNTMMRCDPSVLGGSRRGGWSYLTGRSQNGY